MDEVKLFLEIFRNAATFTAEFGKCIVKGEIALHQTKPNQTGQTEETTMKKIIYNNIEFAVEGMDVYHDGKLLKPQLNKKLNRWYLTVYLGKNWKDVKGAMVREKWGVAYFTVPRYRIIAAANTPDYTYEKYKGLQVDHIDGDPSHDVPSNLRFTTRKRNNSRKMARARKSLNYKHVTHHNELIKAVNAEGKVMLFKNGRDAANGIGCSHVLIYRCLNPEDYAKTAKGWTLSYVPLYEGIIPEEVLKNVQA